MYDFRKIPLISDSLCSDANQETPTIVPIIIHVDTEKFMKAYEGAQKAIDNIKKITVNVPDTTHSREAVEKASKSMNELINRYRKNQNR